MLPALTLSSQIGCHQPRQAPAPAHPVIYPLPPSPARIVFLATIRGAADLGLQPRPMAEFLFGYDPKSVPAISKPFGLATQGRALFVCDTQQNVVHVLDFAARTLASFGHHGAGRLLKPVDVAVDERGRRYVADTGRRQVVVFAPDNRPIRQFGALTRAEDFKPVALAVHRERLYVVNGQAHRVEILDSETGVRIGQIGTRGDQPGQFNFPNGIALDDKGNVYVADTLNCRVQVFDSEGGFTRSFGRPGDRAGQFARPRRLAVGPDAVAYVTDAGFQHVHMYDRNGQVLMLFGGMGTGPGDMMLPAGICISRELLSHFADRIPPGFQAEYVILVANQWGPNKINVYTFGQFKPGIQPDVSQPAHNGQAASASPPRR